MKKRTKINKTITAWAILGKNKKLDLSNVFLNKLEANFWSKGFDILLRKDRVIKVKINIREI